MTFDQKCRQSAVSVLGELIEQFKATWTHQHLRCHILPGLKKDLPFLRSFAICISVKSISLREN
jgi:hypothetical protein